MGQGFANPRAGIALSAGVMIASTGTIVFSNSNGVSFGMNGSVITASAAGPAAIAAGTQTATAGTIVFSNSNNVSFGISNSSVLTASFVGPRGFSAGTQLQTNGTLILSNSNGVTFGLSASSLVTMTFLSNVLGVSAGTQLAATTGTIVLSNSNGISFGMSNSSVITASVNNNPGGIAAGGSTATIGTIVLSSFGMSGSSLATAAFNTGGNSFTYWDNTSASYQLDTSIGYNGTNASSYVVFNIPGFIDATAIEFAAYMQQSTESTAGFSAFIFTVGATNIVLVSSGSTSISFSTAGGGTATSNVGGQIGMRWRSVPVAWAVTPGQYVVAVNVGPHDLNMWQSFGAIGVYNAARAPGGVVNTFTQGYTYNQNTSSVAHSVLNANPVPYIRILGS